MRSELAPKSPKIGALRKISPQMTRQNQVGGGFAPKSPKIEALREISPQTTPTDQTHVN